MKVSKTITIHCCTDCGGLIDASGLCGWTCPQDSTYPGDRDEILKVTYTLKSQKKVPGNVLRKKT